jgi:thiol-disulfide isomerase/thioredoxin
MAAALRWLVLGGAALAAVWLLWPRPQPMPAVSFTLTEGRVLDSAALRGKTVLVNFWSVNCAVCLRDMPALKRLHETLQDFTVIGVAASYDPPPAVMETVARLQPGYPIALDVQGELAHAFGGVTSTPTSFLVDPAGNIQYVERGALDEARVRATILTFQ